MVIDSPLVACRAASRSVVIVGLMPAMFNVVLASASPTAFVAFAV
jgi:hypothetical protein